MISSLVTKLSIRSPLIYSPHGNSSLPLPSNLSSRAASTFPRFHSTTTTPPSTTHTSNFTKSTSKLAPKTRDLPRNVYLKEGLTKPYYASFNFMSHVVNLGYFSSPEKASEAVQNKRFELQSNPALLSEIKPARDLPHCVYLAKRNKMNPYTAVYSFNGQRAKTLGCYPTPEAASKAYEEKMAELRSAMPIKERNLPVGVAKHFQSGWYFGQLKFRTKSITTTLFSSPELASEAIEKRRAECLADPEGALKLKLPRDLPTGVYRVKVKSKLGDDNIAYVAMQSFKKKLVLQKRFATPQLAFEALNKKRESLGIQIGLWDWAHTRM